MKYLAFMLVFLLAACSNSNDTRKIRDPIYTTSNALDTLTMKHYDTMSPGAGNTPFGDTSTNVSANGQNTGIGPTSGGTKKHVKDTARKKY